ncbi:MAG: MBL fold metallo-hydrolase [Candidatus Acidiferrales bacterium]
MKFCMLRSGSSANCTFVEHRATRLLLDAGGMSQRGLLSALSEINVGFGDIHALLVTHLHTDHLNRSALQLCAGHGVPIYIHESNMNELDRAGIAGVRIVPFACGDFTVGAIHFTAFAVDHDSINLTCGFAFWPCDAPGCRVAFATDLGCFPDSLVRHFTNCTCVVLEANHDIGLLWNNPRRPEVHKRRVAADTGHLSNDQAAQALVKICAASRRLPRFIVLSHLSKDHNSPERAVGYVGDRLAARGFSPRLFAASREKRMEFIECG